MLNSPINDQLQPGFREVSMKLGAIIGWYMKLDGSCERRTVFGLLVF
jgi:hypothetical protein